MRNEELLSLHEAATRKAVPPHVIQDAVDSGELTAVRQGGLFFHPDELDRWEPHMKTAAGTDFTDGEAAEYLRTPGTPA